MAVATSTNIVKPPRQTETAAEKVKRLAQAAGPKSRSVTTQGESFTFHSIRDLIELDKYCNEKAIASDPCAAIVDCEIDERKPCRSRSKGGW